MEIFYQFPLLNKLTIFKELGLCDSILIIKKNIHLIMFLVMIIHNKIIMIEIMFFGQIFQNF